MPSPIESHCISLIRNFANDRRTDRQTDRQTETDKQRREGWLGGAGLHVIETERERERCDVHVYMSIDTRT